MLVVDGARSCPVWNGLQTQAQPSTGTLPAVDCILAYCPAPGLQQSERAAHDHGNTRRILSAAGNGNFGLVHEERGIQSDGAVSVGQIPMIVARA